MKILQTILLLAIIILSSGQEVPDNSGDPCAKKILCRDCAFSEIETGTVCNFCHSNVQTNPKFICVNNSFVEQGLVTCRSGWLQSTCLCNEYPTCGNCVTNLNCGWCSGRGCLIGQYQPANGTQCAQKNFRYGRGSCDSSDTIAGIGKSTFIAVMCIVGVCACIIIPVAVLECRTTKKN